MPARKCQPNCDCRKHPRNAHRTPKNQDRDWRRNYVYEDPQRGICVADDDDRPDRKCGSAVRNIKMQLCGKHYGRFQRSGTTKTIYQLNGGAASKPGEGRNIREYGRTQTLDNLALGAANAPCMCGHNCQEHSWRSKKFTHCKIYLGNIKCECQFFDEVNRKMFDEQFTKFTRLGITEYANGNMVCPLCEKVVNIGGWSNPESVRRAAIHITRNCAERNKINVVTTRISDRTGV